MTIISDGFTTNQFIESLRENPDMSLRMTVAGRSANNCAYPRDLDGEHNHDDCLDALAE